MRALIKRKEEKLEFCPFIQCYSICKLDVHMTVNICCYLKLLFASSFFAVNIPFVNSSSGFGHLHLNSILDEMWETVSRLLLFHINCHNTHDSCFHVSIVSVMMALLNSSSFPTSLLFQHPHFFSSSFHLPLPPFRLLFLQHAPHQAALLCKSEVDLTT